MDWHSIFRKWFKLDLEMDRQAYSGELHGRERVYVTEMTIDDGKTALRMENANDRLLFRVDQEANWIQFQGFKWHGLPGAQAGQRANYQILWRRAGAHTVIGLKYVRYGPWEGRSVCPVMQTELDIFMRNKLGAQPGADPCSAAARRAL